jgi:hypothetical protein
MLDLWDAEIQASRSSEGDAAADGMLRSRIAEAVPASEDVREQLFQQYKRLGRPGTLVGKGRGGFKLDPSGREPR